MQITAIIGDFALLRNQMKHCRRLQKQRRFSTFSERKLEKFWGKKFKRKMNVNAKASELDSRSISSTLLVAATKRNFQWFFRRLGTEHTHSLSLVAAMLVL